MQEGGIMIAVLMVVAIGVDLGDIGKKARTRPSCRA
jgi:hypothetical protein